MAEFDHLLVIGSTDSQDFKSMSTGPRVRLPVRDREPHGRRLLGQIAEMAMVQQAITASRQALALDTQGMALHLVFSPRGIYDYKSLEWARDGVELLNVQADLANNADHVIVYVPDGGLDAFEKRFNEYLNGDTRSGAPKNANFVSVLTDIRQAAFDELWTDVVAPPEQGDRRWFQLWLRELAQGPAATKERFDQLAHSLEIRVQTEFLKFPGRIVVAVQSTRQELQGTVQLLDMIAEIRSVPPTAEFFLADLSPADQAEWVTELQGRTTFAEANEDPAYVTLLDTGVNHGHPLLSGALSAEDVRTIHQALTATDQIGHGTEMAGVALHGDLAVPLSGRDPNAIGHRMESVKILPDQGQNPEHLYGTVMRLATASVENPYPDRRRVFAMMTTSVGPTTGSPSEWSATIDKLAFNAVDEIDDGEFAQDAPRLYVLSAGNLPWELWGDYPAVNETTGIENPGQAWNALTVGAFTQLTELNVQKYPSFSVIATDGALSPSSSTSLTWQEQWPYKPDVVAEGGNGSLDSQIHVIVGPESLRITTTYHNMTVALLTETGDTSAAAAETARLCAMISTKYPNYWPESVRALVVHGARYTEHMRSDLSLVASTKEKRNLVRRFGFGAINFENSLLSTSQRPTLILQESIQPYRKEKSALRMSSVNLHELPWPKGELEGLGEATVALRITLSYFVDPNPGQRGWTSRFRYPSHSLRFAVKGATEDEQRFHERINRLDREAAAGDNGIESIPDPDYANWFLGTNMQKRGSIHSDVWIGTAAQLAEKSHIAVFPVGGWWKDWRDIRHLDRKVRYSLVVSLDIAEATDVDIYQPIATQIAIDLGIEIENLAQ